MDYDKDFEDFWQAYRPPPTGLAYDGQRSAKEWIPIRLLHEPIRGLLRQGMESHMKTNQPRRMAGLLLEEAFYPLCFNENYLESRYSRLLI